MLESKTKQIGDMKVEVTLFGGQEALRIKHYLLKIAAPVFSKIVGSLDFQSLKDGKKLYDLNLDGDKLGDALTDFFKQLDEDELINLCKKLLKNTAITIKQNGKMEKINMVAFSMGNDDVFDNVFTKRLSKLYSVLFFILEVNYPDFFEKIKGIGSRLATLWSDKEEDSNKVEVEN